MLLPDNQNFSFSLKEKNSLEVGNVCEEGHINLILSVLKSVTKINLRN